MSKEEFLADLNEQLQKLPDSELHIEYFSLSIRTKVYSWGGDVGVTYSIDERLKLYEKKDFQCEMRYSECEHRGYCNGDC